MNNNISYNLRPFVADDKEDGPDTVLVIKGFKNREEIQDLLNRITDAGIINPNPNPHRPKLVENDDV